MPLLKIHVVKGRSPAETAQLLQAIHDGMVSAFNVPVRDRYQLLTEHEPGHLIMEDTGLGFERTDQRVLIQVVTKARSRELKERLYREIADRLARECEIGGEDLMVSCVDNEPHDWSFGFGRAQFSTGEL